MLGVVGYLAAIFVGRSLRDGAHWDSDRGKKYERGNCGAKGQSGFYLSENAILDSAMEGLSVDRASNALYFHGKSGLVSRNEDRVNLSLNLVHWVAGWGPDLLC
jgi:hypothetical protein